MAERMALNAPIQGSAADIIKLAMLGVHRALRDEGLRSRLLLQVHDELVLEVAQGEREALEALVRREMGGAYPLTVPLDVSVGVGRHLGRGGPLASRPRTGDPPAGGGCDRALHTQAVRTGPTALPHPGPRGV